MTMLDSRGDSDGTSQASSPAPKQDNDKFEEDIPFQTFLIIIDPLVPPNPKEFERKQFIFLLIFSFKIGKFSAAGSSSTIL